MLPIRYFNDGVELYRLITHAPIHSTGNRSSRETELYVSNRNMLFVPRPLIQPVGIRSSRVQMRPSDISERDVWKLSAPNQETLNQHRWAKGMRRDQSSAHRNDEEHARVDFFRPPIRPSVPPSGAPRRRLLHPPQSSPSAEHVMAVREYVVWMNRQRIRNARAQHGLP